MSSPRLFEALTRLRAFEPLRYREYRYNWFAQVFSTLGTWMDEVTRGWLLYELTDSIVQLGLVRGIQTIPYLLLAPLAGSAADRYSRKAQLLIAQFSTALFYATTAALVFTGAIQPWHIYVLAFLIATAQVFQQPARASMIAEAVPHTLLTNAIGFNSLIFNVSRGIGPAIAGALIVAVGTGGSFVVQALLLLAATACTLPLAPLPHTVRSTRESFVRSIVEGWKFSLTDETVRASLGCVMLASLFIIPFTTLLPVFARDLLQVGAPGQGLLLTAMGVGAFISSALVANAGHNLPRGLMMLVSGAFYGVSVAVFAASPWFALSLAAIAFAGLFHVNCNALVQTVIQSYSPQEFRGRTMAIFSMHQAVITLGSIAFGAVAALAGPRLGVIVLALTGALAMGLLAWAMPNTRHIR